MNNGCLEKEVVVRPVDGMQLAEGCIRRNGPQCFMGSLPGIATLMGDTLEEVLWGLDRKAKAYYGDDVVVELVHRSVVA